MFKKIVRSPITSVVLFALAAVLLLTGTIGGTRAALQYFSEDYTSQVELYEIGVTLNENGNPVSFRDYAVNDASGSAEDNAEQEAYWSKGEGALLANLKDLEGNDAEFELGKTYSERLSVTNSMPDDEKRISEFVRVIVYKYWVEVDPVTKEEKKRTDLDPSLIELNFLHDNGNGWLLDTLPGSNTDERTILYYNKTLPVGEPSTDFTDTLTINKEGVMKDATVVESAPYKDDKGVTHKTITTTYKYDGMEFRIEAEVDAVQTHNAEKAIRSAWGPNVHVDGDNLSLG